jgi:Holliday junction resolvasome RuvABC endonuclease subunit
MKLIGIDPGLAACGLAIVELREARPRVLRLQVIRTAPSPKKRRLRSADDLGDRLRTIATVLHARLQEYPDLVAFCVESKAIPFRNGRMMVKPSAVSALGRIRGLVDAFAVERALPIIEETAQTLKLLTAGRKDASKADVQAALEHRFPEVRELWPAQKTLVEHAADAVAAVVAGLESDVVRAALRARACPTELPSEEPCPSFIGPT